MTSEKFIMVSLDEDKSKELANVISSDTARKILDYLGSKDNVAESQISRALNIPLSTVHYNIRQLLGAGLVESSDFAWSEKGKKVELYSVSRKIVIIAPKGSESFMDKVKSIIPVALISFVGAGFVYAYSKFINSMGVTLEAAQAEDVMFAAPEMAKAGGAVEETMMGYVTSEPNIALWFLLGSVFTILIYLLFLIYRRYRRKSYTR